MIMNIESSELIINKNIQLVPWFLAKCKEMLYYAMSPAALNRFFVNTSQVKQFKPNVKILNPSNYFSKTKQYFLKQISTEAATCFHQ